MSIKTWSDQFPYRKDDLVYFFEIEGYSICRVIRVQSTNCYELKIVASEVWEPGTLVLGARLAKIRPFILTDIYSEI